MRKKTNISLPEFMSKRELAEYFQVSPRTVERMFNDGLLSVKIRNKRYVNKEDLLDFLRFSGFGQ